MRMITMSKKVEQEGIMVHAENSTNVRLCPRCKGKLRIDTSSFKVFCSCGYIESCHLRKLKISEVNCSSCPYSAQFREDLALKTIKANYFKSLPHKNQYTKVLPLGAVTELIQENLAFPKLKGKCYQSWSPKRTLKVTEIR
jgi:hypothetical protein